MKAKEENFYRAPVAETVVGLEAFSGRKGGIGRLMYFFALLGCYFAIPIALLIFFVRFFYETVGFALLPLGFSSLALPVVATYYRMKNIGGNPHWAWATLIPLVNLALIFWCLCAPEGFDDHQKWDGASAVVAILLGLLVFFVLIAIAV